MLNSLSWYALLGNLHAWDSQELRFKVWATDVSLAFERLFIQIKTFSLKVFFPFHLLQNSLHIIQLFQTASRFLMRSWLSATTYMTFLKLDEFFISCFQTFCFLFFVVDYDKCWWIHVWGEFVRGLHSILHLLLFFRKFRKTSTIASLNVFPVPILYFVMKCPSNKLLVTWWFLDNSYMLSYFFTPFLSIIIQVSCIWEQWYF